MSVHRLLLPIIAVLLLGACTGPYSNRQQAWSQAPYSPDYYLNRELAALRHSGVWTDDGLDGRRHAKDVFPLPVNNQVRAYLKLFQGEQRESFTIWLERSGRYLPLIRSELQRRGLPLDLAYLAMIESGYNPTACSSAKAVGLWQFITSTGKNQGLIIDRYVDERRDPVKATRAAVDYLESLYQRFGNWHLAVAGYNGGPRKVELGLEKYHCHTFWQLARNDYLALETKRYVPKLIAAILIARQPQRYGFTDIKYQTPLRHDSIEVPGGLSLAAAALISRSNVKELQQLNPELLTDSAPPNRSRYRLNLAPGSGQIARANLVRLHPVVTTKQRQHRVTAGDTLYALAQTYQIPAETIAHVNRIQANQLHSGQLLNIPIRRIDYRLLPQDQDLARRQQAATRVVHRVRPGESAQAIANQHGVPAHLLPFWNRGLTNSRLKPGQHLALYMDQRLTPRTPSTGNDHLPTLSGQAKTLSPVGKISRTRAQALPLITAKQQKRRLFPAPKAQPARYYWYLVQNGDSLWGIAQRFNTSPARIRALNNLESNHIQPGRRLKISKG